LKRLYLQEISYAIKRLVRGNGSSTSNSRIGFYTALTGFLSAEVDGTPNVEEILSIMKKEFKEGSNEKATVDSLVGVALVCGAIIRSDKAFKSTSASGLEEIVKSLSSCMTKPSVAPIAYNFLAELVTKVSAILIHFITFAN
jgi:DNA polymerase phi